MRKFLSAILSISILAFANNVYASASADGSANGYAHGGDHIDYQWTGDFTVAFWVKSTATNQFAIGSYTRNAGNYTIYADSGVGDCTTTSYPMMAATAISGTVLCGPSTDLLDGSWHSVMVIRSGSTVSWYTDNGTPTTGTASGTTFAAGTSLSKNFTISADYNAGTRPNATTYYAKYVIYDGTAWDATARSNYHNSCTIPASPTAQWDFASSVALNTDSSGNSHTLTPGGTGAGWTYTSDAPTACGAAAPAVNALRIDSF